MVALPLDEMTVEEKLQAMKMLWENRSQNEDNIPSPAWHEEVPRKREAALERGEDEPEG